MWGGSFQAGSSEEKQTRARIFLERGGYTQERSTGKETWRSVWTMESVVASLNQGPHGSLLDECGGGVSPARERRDGVVGAAVARGGDG